MEVSQLGPVVNLITGAAGALVVLVIFAYLFVTDRLHSNGEYKRLGRQSAEWKTLYDRECEAHRKTREALVLANDRAEAAVETAKVTRQLLEALKTRTPPRRSHGGGA